MEPKFKIGQIVYFFRYDLHSFECRIHESIKNNEINSIKISKFRIIGFEERDIEIGNNKLNFVYKVQHFNNPRTSFYCLEDHILEKKEECVALLIKNFTEKFSLAITETD